MRRPRRTISSQNTKRVSAKRVPVKRVPVKRVSVTPARIKRVMDRELEQIALAVQAGTASEEQQQKFYENLQPLVKDVIKRHAIKSYNRLLPEDLQSDGIARVWNMFHEHPYDVDRSSFSNYVNQACTFHLMQKSTKLGKRVKTQRLWEDFKTVRSDEEDVSYGVDAIAYDRSSAVVDSALAVDIKVIISELLQRHTGKDEREFLLALFGDPSGRDWHTPSIDDDYKKAVGEAARDACLPEKFCMRFFENVVQKHFEEYFRKA